MRTLLTSIVALLTLSLTYTWESLPKTSQDVDHYYNSGELFPPPPLWISLLASCLIGVITNIYRATSVFACQELEQFAIGSAGIVGNIINSSYIIFHALYGYLFFGEVMTKMSTVGAFVISLAIILVTVVRMARGMNNGQQGEEEEQQGEDTEEKAILLREAKSQGEP